MPDATVYYCWVCDAHRRVLAGPDGTAQCPRCEHELTSDSRLPLRVVGATKSEPVVNIVWPAPIRPRLAQSA